MKITHNSAAAVADREFKVQIREINPSDLSESKKMLSCLLSACDC